MKIGRVLIGAAVLFALVPGSLRAQMYPEGRQTALDDATIAADSKIIAEITDHNEIMSNLEYLSDMIGQRLTGSENLKKANDWTKEKFTAYGVSNAHLEAWQIAHSWTRGAARGRIISPSEHSLTLASYGWAPGTNGIVRGHIVYVDVRSIEDLEKYKGKLKDAIVITAERRRCPRPIHRRLIRCWYRTAMRF
jgi:hypothetical protein